MQEVQAVIKVRCRCSVTFLPLYSSLTLLDMHTHTHSLSYATNCSCLLVHHRQQLPTSTTQVRCCIWKCCTDYVTMYGAGRIFPFRVCWFWLVVFSPVSFCRFSSPYRESVCSFHSASVYPRGRLLLLRPPLGYSVFKISK
jgi:hypothetical protein